MPALFRVWPHLFFVVTATTIGCDTPGDGSNLHDGVLDVTNDLTGSPDVVYAPAPIIVASGQLPLPQGAVVPLGPSSGTQVIRVVAAETVPVVVTGIGWARGTSGLPENNPHVRILPVALPVQLTTLQAELTFSVQLATPYNDVNDDSPSTLIITTEFTDAFGAVTTHEFPLVVEITRFPVPSLEVRPDADPSRLVSAFGSLSFLQTPDRFQTATVSLRQARSDGWFHVIRYELESPSTELKLSSDSTTPLKIGPFPNAILDVLVSFTPQSETPTSNAILFYLDSQEAPLRVPIAMVAPVENHL